MVFANRHYLMKSVVEREPLANRARYRYTR